MDKIINKGNLLFADNPEAMQAAHIDDLSPEDYIKFAGPKDLEDIITRVLLEFPEYTFETKPTNTRTIFYVYQNSVELGRLSVGYETENNLGGVYPSIQETLSRRASTGEERKLLGKFGQISQSLYEAIEKHIRQQKFNFLIAPPKPGQAGGNQSPIVLQRAKPGAKAEPLYDEAFDIVSKNNFTQDAYNEAFDWYCQQANLTKPDKKARGAFKQAMKRRRDGLVTQ